MDEDLASSQKEIVFRKSAVRNMWIMIITIFLVDTIGTAYSLSLYIWAGGNCFIQDTIWVRSVSTVIQRSIEFVWWLYPVMWLFWPRELSCNKAKATGDGDKGASGSR